MTDSRAFEPGQRLLLCRARRMVVTFLDMEPTPGRARITMPDGSEESALVNALHVLGQIVQTYTPHRGMDSSGWHGFIYDDDPDAPHTFRALWQCSHLHRGPGAAQGCALDEFTRWVSCSGDQGSQEG